MVKFFDRRLSYFLKDQICRFQDLKVENLVSIPMDIPSSIISQVAKDAELRHNSVNSSRSEVSVRSSVKKKGKPDNHNTTFRSMFCCFGRPRRKVTLTSKPVHDMQIATVNGKADHTPPPTPTISSNNVLTEETSCSNRNHTYLLPTCPQNLRHKKCAVIDLDETLVHSSFKPISNADFIVPVEIDGTVHQVYVLKRPHVDTYLKRMGELYECVLFTASLSKYADPVADLLDKQGVFTSRLFRESCVFHRGNYVKDLSLIGRDLNKVIIVDNSPASYIFHPDNAVPVLSWFDDPSDTELLELLPTLEAIAEADDVYSVLRSNGFTSQAQEITATIKLQQEQFQPRPAQSPIAQVDNER